MVANLNETNGKVNMMYVGEEPWHGLGTKLDKEATAAEALVAAGLNWEVKKVPLFIKEAYGADSVGGLIKVPNHYATVRADTNVPLGVVGEAYTAFQNKSNFSFLDAVVGIKEAIYHTAGALGRGEIVWVLAKLKGVIKVTGDDVVEKFLLLTNRHDGIASATVMLTPIRVVCQNTLRAALDERDKDGNLIQRVALRHTVNIGGQQNIDEVRKVLGIVNAKFDIFGQAARKLAATQVTQEALHNFYADLKLAPTDDMEDGRMKTIKEEVEDVLTCLFEKGKGNDMVGVKGSWWAAYNSVTEYVDYVRPVRGEKTKVEERTARAKALLFGTGADLKERAWGKALEAIA